MSNEGSQAGSDLIHLIKDFVLPAQQPTKKCSGIISSVSDITLGESLITEMSSAASAIDLSHTVDFNLDEPSSGYVKIVGIDDTYEIIEYSENNVDDGLLIIKTHGASSTVVQTHDVGSMVYVWPYQTKRIADVWLPTISVGASSLPGTGAGDLMETETGSASGSSVAEQYGIVADVEISAPCVPYLNPGDREDRETAEQVLLSNNPGGMVITDVLPTSVPKIYRGNLDDDFYPTEITTSATGTGPASSLLDYLNSTGMVFDITDEFFVEYEFSVSKEISLMRLNTLGDYPFWIGYSDNGKEWTYICNTAPSSTSASAVLTTELASARSHTFDSNDAEDTVIQFPEHIQARYCKLYVGADAASAKSINTLNFGRVISADEMRLGTLDAGVVNVKNLNASSINAGTLNSDNVNIKGQNNNIILGASGLLLQKASDPSVYIKFDPNDIDGFIGRFAKGAIRIEDGDEQLILDEDGIVADGIVRGIMPGSDNPIVNSSFEKTTGGATPAAWAPNTAAEWGDDADPLPKRADNDQVAIVGNTVKLTAPALTVVEDDNADIVYTGAWEVAANAFHSAGHAKLAYRLYGSLFTDSFNRADNSDLGENWRSFSIDYKKSNGYIHDNIVYQHDDTHFGALSNIDYSAAQCLHSSIVSKEYFSYTSGCLAGIIYCYGGNIESAYSVRLYYSQGGNALTLQNGTGNQKVDVEMHLDDDTWYWFKLKRDGDVVRAYSSSDGVTWNYRAKITVAGLSGYGGRVGMYAWSYDGHWVAFDNFDFKSTYGQTQPYAEYTIPVGTRGCKIYAPKGNDLGKFNITVDGVALAGSPFDTYNAAALYQQNIASITGLNPLVSHALLITVDDDINASITAGEVGLCLDKLGLSGEGYITMRNDLTAVPTDWNFTHTYNAPSNASIITEYRSSADNITWSEWVISFASLHINRYIEIRECLTSYDGSANPILNSFTLSYTLTGMVVPTDWTISGAGSANVGITQSDFKYGTKCLYCNHAASSEAKIYQEISVKPNTDYMLSAYYKCNELSANGATVKILKDLAGEVLVTSDIITGTALNWERSTLSLPFNSAECETIIVEITIGEIGALAYGELFIDAIRLNEGAVVQPWAMSLYDFLDQREITNSVCAYKKTAVQTIPTGSWTTAVFDTEMWDYNDEFASSTFTAKVEGIYQVSARVMFQTGVNSGTGWRGSQLLVNGVARAYGTRQAASVSFNVLTQVNSDIFLNVGDDVTVQVYQNNGTDQTTLAMEIGQSISIHRIR